MSLWGGGETYIGLWRLNSLVSPRGGVGWGVGVDREKKEGEEVTTGSY